MLKVQAPPAGNATNPQVLLWTKSPVTARPMFSGTDPVFVNVTDCGALVVPSI